MPYKDPEKRRACNAANMRRARAEALPKPKKTFCAVDSEGTTYGEPFVEVDVHSGKRSTYRKHGSMFWAAGTNEHDIDYLLATDGKCLGSIQIIDWLLALPVTFPNSIFVGFALSYDFAQVMKDLPYKIARQIQGRDKAPEAQKQDNMRVIFWNGYGFKYMKSKELTLYRNPRYEWKLIKGKRVRFLKYDATIRLFDVFGFFQASFLKALGDFDGALTKEEFKIVEQGKSGRASFTFGDIPRLKKYTELELKGLSRMMTMIRDAMSERFGFDITAWHGAGSIASALLKKYKVSDHVAEASADPDPDCPQMWAHHAFFGGRIEMMKQGVHNAPLWGYDLASAYPAACVQLPGSVGLWTLVNAPSWTDVEQASALSMFEIDVEFASFENKDKYPFFPLPYRDHLRCVYYPRRVKGRYMRDEILAARAWCEHFNAPLFEIKRAQLFVPASEELPLAFIRDLFNERARIVMEAKKDGVKPPIFEKVIKLGINSVYGKMAQSVGDKPPKTASPVHAAAITAWCRAKVLMAALTNPWAVVQFATDGIITDQPLSVDIPKAKTLGLWEQENYDQGIFIMSGIYGLGVGGKIKTKSRGFRPINLNKSVDRLLYEDVAPCWADPNKQEYSYVYNRYVTLGTATASEKSWLTIGCWGDCERKIELIKPGRKRNIVKNGEDRQVRLMMSTPAEPIEFVLSGDIPMSIASRPDWLDKDYQEKREADEDHKNVTANF